MDTDSHGSESFEIDPFKVISPDKAIPTLAKPAPKGDVVEPSEPDAPFELILKAIFKENHHISKKSQKRKKITIFESGMSLKLLESLEKLKISLHGCRICETVFEVSPLEHIQDKDHIKVREGLGLKPEEDLELSIMLL